jgi:hypothetical protein
MTTYIVNMNFDNDTTNKEVIVNIKGQSYNFYFVLSGIENFTQNEVADNLFLSVYTTNKSKIYFGSLRCVFGSYINFVDNGFPYLIFFKDTSTNLINKTVTFKTLNSGVSMYLMDRSDYAIK